MAKKKKQKKKKSSSGAAVGVGVRGFGSTASTISVPSSSSDTPGDDPVMDRSRETLAFYDYIERQGATAASNLKRVALAHFPLPDADIKEESRSMRGVMALKSIPKGQPILTIPYNMALNYGERFRFLEDVSVAGCNFLQEICTATQEKQESAHDVRGSAAAYIHSLPKYKSVEACSSTLHFSNAALEALQLPYLRQQTLQRRQCLKDRYTSDMYPMMQIETGPFHLNEDHPATVDHLQWATWLISSRLLTFHGGMQENMLGGDEGGSSWGLPNAKSQGYQLLVPLMDMCNHDRESLHVLQGQVEPGGVLQLVAGCNVAPGEQITLNYGGGVMGNDVLLRDYGFLDSHPRGYEIVADQLLRKTKQAEAALTEDECEAALEALRQTSVEDDEAMLKNGEMEKDVRRAMELRVGIKTALAAIQPV